MKRIKGLLAMILGVVLALQSTAALSVNASSPKDAPSPEPALSLRLKGENTPVFKYGETKNLELTLVNNGAVDAEKVKVAPKLNAKTEKWPFEIEKAPYEQEIEKVAAGGSEEMFFALVPRQDVESKYYKIIFNISYENNTFEQSIFVKMEGAPEPEKEPEKQPEKEPETTPPDNSGGGGEISLPNEGGGSVTNNEGSGDGLTPRVIVTGFTTEPGEVKAGSNFKLIVHLRNTSKTTAVKNMLFNFNAPAEGSDADTTSPAFLPSSGSSTVYLDAIKVNGTKDVSIELNAKADLVQKPYSIEMSMAYEDGNGGQYESSSSISVPIKQDARFEFSEFEMSSETVEVGGEINVMCNLYNLGRVKLYNLKARFEGSDIKSKELFIGNVEPGATAVIDGMITGEQETTGDGKIKLMISYEDESGVVSSAEQELTLFVTAPILTDVMEGDESMVDDMEEKAFPIIPAAVAVIVIAVIAAVVIVKKRKKKKAYEEEEGFLEDELNRLIEDERRES